MSLFKEYSSARERETFASMWALTVLTGFQSLEPFFTVYRDLACSRFLRDLTLSRVWTSTDLQSARIFFWISAMLDIGYGGYRMKRNIQNFFLDGSQKSN